MNNKFPYANHSPANPPATPMIVPEAENDCDAPDFLTGVTQTVYLAMSCGNVSVKWIAHEMNLTEQSFRRRLRKYVSLTPKGFFSTIQMNRAATLLLENANLPISHVAECCGFENSSSFCHKFKNYFGYPPSLHRQKNRIVKKE